MRLQSADEAPRLDDDLVILGDNAPVMAALPDETFDLVYMDPPFNTGRAQARHTLAHGQLALLAGAVTMALGAAGQRPVERRLQIAHRSSMAGRGGYR